MTSSNRVIERRLTRRERHMNKLVEKHNQLATDFQSEWKHLEESVERLFLAYLDKEPTSLTDEELQLLGSAFQQAVQSRLTYRMTMMLFESLGKK